MSLRRAARWLLASVLMLWCAAPSWAGMVDDLFISLVYADALVSGDGLVWSTGERVEGYSNVLLIALLAPWLSSGLDPILVAQCLSMMAGLGVLAVASAVAPDGWRGDALVCALALWFPLCHWSAMGMETVLAALLAGTGWLLVVGSTRHQAAGMILLVLFSLARPEGALLVALGLVRWLLGARQGRAVVGVGVVGLVGYHAARIAWFGAVLPTPFLVKIQGAKGDGTLIGLQQVSGELLSALGLVVAAVVLIRPPRRLLLWIGMPLGISTAMLLRANGDWMGDGRLLSIGLIASVLTWVAAGEARRTGWLQGAAVLAAPLWSFCMLSPAYRGGLVNIRSTMPSWSGYQAPLYTPMPEEVAFLIHNVPAGESAMTAAVGVSGHIPDLLLVDVIGLTNRAAAERQARDRLPFQDNLARAIQEDSPDFLRLYWVGEAAPLPAALTDHFTLRESLSVSHGRLDWWATHAQRPAAETIHRRWAALADRFPAHPFFCGPAVRSQAAVGDVEGAIQRDRGCASRWPDDSRFGQAPQSVAFPAAPTAASYTDRGLGLYWNQTVRSVAVPARMLHTLTVTLQADAPGADGAQASLRWVGPCGESTQDVAVFEVTRVAAPMEACEQNGSGYLEVAFRNDHQEDNRDRNLYVILEGVEAAYRD